MSISEVLFIVFPMMLLLLWIIAYEIKTGIIQDRVVFPAALYFLAASSVCGTRPWWDYFLGMTGLVLFFLLLAILVKSIFRTDMIGGGAIKLMGVLGASLGYYAAVETGVIFIAFMIVGLIIARFVSGTDSLPSSPFALVTLLIVYSLQYGTGWPFAQDFSVVALGYLGLSLTTIFSMMVMNQRRKTLFAAHFGDGITDLDLDEEELRQWTELHEVKFNRGWWRFVLNVYLCIHYPGLLVMGALLHRSLHPLAMFLISGVVWLGVAYVILS